MLMGLAGGVVAGNHLRRWRNQGCGSPPSLTRFGVEAGRSWLQAKQISICPKCVR